MSNDEGKNLFTGEQLGILKDFCEKCAQEDKEMHGITGNRKPNPPPPQPKPSQPQYNSTSTHTNPQPKEQHYKPPPSQPKPNQGIVNNTRQLCEYSERVQFFGGDKKMDNNKNKGPGNFDINEKEYDNMYPSDDLKRKVAREENRMFGAFGEAFK